MKMGKGMVFQPDAAIVQTGAGTVRGYIDDGILTFKGIPYAAAERFEEPHPITWDGILNTVVYRGKAPQAAQNAGLIETMMPHLFWPTVTKESEIQSLNIWTTGTKGKKPVMFWIHGGAFVAGSAYEQICFDGKFLAERGDIVLVSINHRLNCLGYLDLSDFGEEYANSGNLGQMDIVAALRWVKENIEAFGGDPDNVTVFGQSGGGRKILNLMGTPAAKGLFHKAIGESCGQQSVKQAFAKRVGAETMKLLGAESVDEIKEIPYEKLSAAADQALAQVNAEDGSRFMWSPVEGGSWMPVDIWLQDSIGENAADIPLLIGSNFAELTTNAFAMMAGKDPIYKNAFSEEEAAAFLQKKYGENTEAVVDAFREAYPLKPVIDAAFVDVMTYRAWVKAVLPRKAAQAAPVYNYVFAYELPTMGGWLPYHCSELPFVWHNLQSERLTVGTGEEQEKLSDLMCDAWLSFVKTGDPNHEGMINWPQWTLEDGATMIFDKECMIGHNHDDRLQAEIIKSM